MFAFFVECIYDACNLGNREWMPENRTSPWKIIFTHFAASFSSNICARVSAAVSMVTGVWFPAVSGPHTPVRMWTPGCMQPKPIGYNRQSMDDEGILAWSAIYNRRAHGPLCIAGEATHDEWRDIYGLAAYYRAVSQAGVYSVHEPCSSGPIHTADTLNMCAHGRRPSRLLTAFTHQQPAQHACMPPPSRIW